MQIIASELVAAISSVLDGIDEKAPLADYKDVVLTDNLLVTYNDRVGVVTKLSTSFPTHAAVNCNDFLKSAKSFEPTATITIAIEESSLIMTCNEDEVVLALSAVENHQVMQMRDVLTNPPPLQPCPDDFINALICCQFSLAKYSTFRVLACVSVDGSIVNSSDDLRVSEYVMNGSFNCPPFLLFHSSVAMLTSFNITTYGYQDTWMFFGCSDNTYIYCQLVKDEFPNPDELFNVDGPSFVLPQEMKTAIDACSYLADDAINGYLFLNVTIEAGKITVAGKRAKGSIKKTIPYPSYKGEKVLFSAQPSFLVDVLAKSAQMTIGPTSALFESGSFRHVISLKVN